MSNQRFNATIKIGGALEASLKNALGSTQNELRGIGHSIRDLNKRQARLKSAAAHWEKMGRNAGRFHDELKQVNAQLDKQKRMGDVIRAQQRNMDNRANLRGQLFDAVAIGATLAVPVKLAIDFESSMADVNKVVDQTKEQGVQMGKEIIKATRSIPIAAKEMASIVASGGQAGLARAELVGFAIDAAKMGVAFDMSADQAGESMVKWRTALQLGQKEVVALADQINFLSNTSGATADGISDIVTRVGGLGKSAGLNGGQVAALGSTLLATGVKSEVAATSLQNMFLALGAGEAATAGQAGALRELGFDAQTMAQMMQDDAEGAIISVLEAINRLDDTKRNPVLQELFGKESIKGLSQITNNTDLLKKAFGDVGDSAIYAGSMQKEYEARSKTTANSIILLKNKAAGLAITIGSVLLPGIVAVSGGLGAVAGVAADFADKHPTLTKVVVGSAAALMGFKVAAIAGGFAMTFITGGALSAVGILIKFGGALMFTGKAALWMGRALLMNPIGLTIVALAAGAYLIYKNWDTLKKWWGKAWDWIGDKAEIAKDVIFGVLSWTPIGIVVTNWEPVKNFFKKLWDDPKQAAQDFFSFITDKIAWVGDQIKAVKGFFGKDTSVTVRRDREGGQVGDAIKKPNQSVSNNPAQQSAQATIKAASSRRGAGAKVSQSFTDSSSYTIYQQPGQSASDLAREIDRLKKRKQRSSLFDNPTAYGAA